jgi:hypothetical protein
MLFLFPISPLFALLLLYFSMRRDRKARDEGQEQTRCADPPLTRRSRLGDAEPTLPMIRRLRLGEVE